jgi:hypothetical protein
MFLLIMMSFLFVIVVAYVHHSFTFEKYPTTKQYLKLLFLYSHISSNQLKLKTLEHIPMNMSRLIHLIASNEN